MSSNGQVNPSKSSIQRRQAPITPACPTLPLFKARTSQSSLPAITGITVILGVQLVADVFVVMPVGIMTVVLLLVHVLMSSVLGLPLVVCVCVLFNARLVCAEGTDHSASRGASGVPAQPKAAGQLGAGSPRQSIYMCFLGHLVGAHSTALVGVCTKERAAACCNPSAHHGT